MPARDAKQHGNIKRSNRFPNCSYFTNWTSSEDYISWDSEVLTDGNYEVEIYYACEAKDVGARIELEWMNEQLQATITEAHTPPLRGAENDRVQRSESYVKAFKPMTLGTISLKKGRGQLKLRAPKIPGQSAIEFRLMMLKRL